MNQASIFLEKLYRETTQLLSEARSYITFAEGASDKLDSNVRLLVSYETLRVTARLSQVMTWLLTEKAVIAEEIRWIKRAVMGFRFMAATFAKPKPKPRILRKFPLAW